MRKLTYLSAIVLLYTFSSCGGSATCDCVDLSLEIIKEVKVSNGDPVKMKALEAKYREDLDKCNKTIKGKKEEDFKKCPSYNEFINMRR